MSLPFDTLKPRGPARIFDNGCSAMVSIYILDEQFVLKGSDKENDQPTRPAKSPKTKQARTANSAKPKKTITAGNNEAKKLYTDTLEALDKRIDELDKRVNSCLLQLAPTYRVIPLFVLDVHGSVTPDIIVFIEKLTYHVKILSIIFFL
jgi:hypothetical protein